MSYPATAGRIARHSRVMHWARWRSNEELPRLRRLVQQRVGLRALVKAVTAVRRIRARQQVIALCISVHVGPSPGSTNGLLYGHILLPTYE